MHQNELTYLFLKLNIWLSFTSTLMVIATAMALSIPLNEIGIALALPALLFYFIYTEDRRNVSPEDRINEPYRTQLVEKYQTALLATEIAALTAYEGIVVFLIYTTPAIGPVYLLLAQLPLAVLVAYDQLKQYPTFDSLAVGSTWSFVIMFSTVIATATPITPQFFIVTGTWLLIVIAGVESRNVRDIDGDNETEKTTLAGYLGKRRTEFMNVTLKTISLGVFLVTTGVLTTLVVLLYLIFLQVFRELTARANTLTAPKDTPEQDPLTSSPR